MVSVRLEINTAIFDGVDEYLSTRPAIVQKISERVYRRHAPAILVLLKRIPGKPNYPIVWKTERQRRFVMAMLTRRAKENGRYPDISYQRTGEGSDSWVWKMTSGKHGVGLDISSAWAASQFVYGTLNQQSATNALRPQQPFHAGRWPEAARIVKEGFVRIQAEIEKELAKEDQKAFKLIIRRRSKRMR